MTKPEIRKKLGKIRNPKSKNRDHSDFESRSSFGFRTSDFGLRPLSFVIPHSSFVILLLLCGCAGYQLGPTNGVVAREKSIQVVPFSNQTLEPRLTDAVTSQLRKQLQHDGTYQLATHDEGDFLLSGVITYYRRHELSFAPNDILTVRDYRLELRAQITLLNRTAAKVILSTNTVSGFTLIRVESDLPSTERQALPLL